VSKAVSAGKQADRELTGSRFLPPNILAEIKHLIASIDRRRLASQMHVALVPGRQDEKRVRSTGREVIDDDKQCTRCIFTQL
jgi:hypothetical protein